MKNPHYLVCGSLLEIFFKTHIGNVHDDLCIAIYFIFYFPPDFLQ